MMWLFRRFMTESLAIERDEFCLSINAYTNNGLTFDQIESFSGPDRGCRRWARRSCR